VGSVYELLILIGVVVLVAFLFLRVFVMGYNLGRHATYESITFQKPTTEPITVAPAKEPKKQTQEHRSVSVADPGGPFAAVAPFAETNFGNMGEMEIPIPE
jgi:hypothetical protein